MGEVQTTSGGVPRARRRVPCFEWIRAAGCVAITLLHVFVSLDNAVGIEALSPSRVLVEDLVAVTFTRWAVPVFLMVTGALLLDPKRKVSWARIGHYAARMLFTLATFGLLFCLIESVYDHHGVSLAVVGEALRNLVTGHSWDHLWYVYALLFLYLLTPGFRWLVGRLSRAGYAFLLGLLYLVVLVVPTALFWSGRHFSTPFNVVPAMFYYLLGQYAWRYLRPQRGAKAPARPVVIAGAVSLVALIICAATGNAVYALPEFCVICPFALLVFCLFMGYATEPIERHPAAALLADYSFGIYVVHPFFLHVITHLVNPLAIPVVLYELMALTIALAGSLGVVWLVRHIPGFEGRI